MKYLLIIALLAAGCKPPSNGHQISKPATVNDLHQQTDTNVGLSSNTVDSQITLLNGAPEYIHDTVYIRADCSASKRKIDSLQTALFVAKYKIERVRYYWKIAVNKPTQRKFLTSWVGRAIQ